METNTWDKTTSQRNWMNKNTQYGTEQREAWDEKGRQVSLLKARHTLALTWLHFLNLTTLQYYWKSRLAAVTTRGTEPLIATIWTLHVSKLSLACVLDPTATRQLSNFRITSITYIWQCLYLLYYKFLKYRYGRICRQHLPMKPPFNHEDRGWWGEENLEPSVGRNMHVFYTKLSRVYEYYFCEAGEATGLLPPSILSFIP